MAPRVVLITGTNSGVGYAISKVLATASSDFHVVMTGRSLQKVEKAKSEIESAGISGTLVALQLDVTDEESIEKAVAFVEQKYGKLDALINNAAAGSVVDNVKDRFRVSFDTNVIGPAVVAAAFRPLLLKSEKPYSIYVTSGMGSLSMALDPNSLGYTGLPNDNAYRSCKAALNMIMVSEWKEFQSRGLKSFTMCPGFVRSHLRGDSEEAISGWGKAGDPMVSGRTVLSILQGERDDDAGKFVHKDGTYPW